jgi:hypothetical protein
VYAQYVRETMRDDFGNEVYEQIATGAGPCRVSLKPFRVGEEARLVLSHSPFTLKNAFNQAGPIFINKEAVEEYQDIHRFPPEIKADKQNFPLSLIGYSHDQRMIFSRLVGEADIEDLIEEVFAQYAEIAYLHARNAEACCYICTIERL